MAFRFWAFRRWVFPDVSAAARGDEIALAGGGIAEAVEDVDGGQRDADASARRRAVRLTIQLGDSSEPRVSKTS